MNDPLSVLVWEAHESWCATREARRVAQERWSTDEWWRARILADEDWTAHPAGLYLYSAERALREVQYERARAELEGRRRAFERAL